MRKNKLIKIISEVINIQGINWIKINLKTILVKTYNGLGNEWLCGQTDNKQLLNLCIVEVYIPKHRDNINKYIWYVTKKVLLWRVLFKELNEHIKEYFKNETQLFEVFKGKIKLKEFTATSTGLSIDYKINQKKKISIQFRTIPH